ncbi:MAG: FAD-dependent oxidoreductase [Acidobacteriota bacterium]
MSTEDRKRPRRKVTPLENGQCLEVLVVGAGIAGLAAARTLHDHGHRVTVLDKGRGPGGRMSTRRRGELRFDHGAQYFTARDRRFRRWVETWFEDDLVAPWSGRLVTLEADADAEPQPKTAARRWIAVPGMNALCRHLAEDLEVHFERRVATLERRGDRWLPRDASGGEMGEFDAAIVTAPAPQTAELLAVVAPTLAAAVEGAEMAPCWAAMATFESPLELPFDAAFVQGSPLAWLADNGSKAKRPAGQSWVLHGSPEWSQRHLEGDPEAVAEALVDAFWQAVGGSAVASTHLVAHRWRYARTVTPVGQACLFDPDLRLAAAGDWCLGERVEQAFLSGCAAAGRLLGRPAIPSQGLLFE